MAVIALSVAYKALSFGGKLASLNVVNEVWNTELQQMNSLSSGPTNR